MAPSPPPPFHRLLAFYSNRNPHDPQTIRFQDSVSGNLALGLDFAVAVGVAVGRHLWLRNVRFSLDIHVPRVGWAVTPLDGVRVEAGRAYTRAEIVGLAWRGGGGGMAAALDALGLWALAADVRTGLLRGEDVLGFQEGGLFERIERRRRGREQVLPLWRGGPVSAVGHSWVVGRLFGVAVYRSEEEKDD